MVYLPPLPPNVAFSLVGYMVKHTRHQSVDPGPFIFPVYLAHAEASSIPCCVQVIASCGVQLGPQFSKCHDVLSNIGEAAEQRSVSHVRSKQPGRQLSGLGCYWH